MRFIEWRQVGAVTERGAQREGQFWFNLLSSYRPDLARQIRATQFDPFYDDSRLQSFVTYVQDHWSVPPGGEG